MPLICMLVCRVEILPGLPAWYIEKQIYIDLALGRLLCQLHAAVEDTVITWQF